MIFFEHIDDYKDGSLKGEELRLFEEALENDTDLRAAVDNYDVAKGISEGVLELDVMGVIEGLEPVKKEVKTPFLTLRKFLVAASVAASVAGVVFFGGLQMWSSPKNNSINKKLLAEVYKKPKIESGTRAVDTTGMTTFEKGKYFLAGGLFSDSERTWNEFIENTTNQDSLSIAYYWLGSAYWELGEFGKAKAAWEQSEEEEVRVYLEVLNGK